jgi:hypothetical protein
MIIIGITALRSLTKKPVVVKIPVPIMLATTIAMALKKPRTGLGFNF